MQWVFDSWLGNDVLKSKVKVSDYVKWILIVYVAANGKVSTPASLTDYLAAYGYSEPQILMLLCRRRKSWCKMTELLTIWM
jgi:hypothetical protein